MKLIIIVGVLIACLYFWHSRSNNSPSVKDCASLGGNLTVHGCEVPMTEEKCKSLGGSIIGGDCQLKKVE